MSEYKKKFLSVCIPTYNRFCWIKKSVEILEIECSDLLDKVEIIISDNCSTDNTSQILTRAENSLSAIVNRNKSNNGAIYNLDQCTKMASGKYVWVLGDDDLLLPNSLRKLVELIENKVIDEPLIFVGNKVWTPNNNTKEELESSRFLDLYYQKNGDFDIRIVRHLSELAKISTGYFNAINNIIVKNEHAKKLFKSGLMDSKIHTSIQTTFPHSAYIAENLLNKPAAIINNALTLCSSKVSWSEYYPITYLKLFPDLIHLMTLNGGSKIEKSIALKWILKNHKHKLAASLATGFRNSDIFSMREFILRNWNFKEFWMLMKEYISLRLKRKNNNN